MAKHFTLPLFLFGSLLILTSAAKKVRDLEAAESIASDHKVQAVEPSRKYGYPYRIAPTLGPAIEARSDDDENTPPRTALKPVKSYGSRVSSSSEEDVVVKKGQSKKAKVIHATRRQDGDDSSVEKKYRSYVEPKYRNLYELEVDFQPRRMDTDIPYSQYAYPKPLRKPPISPIDPYLTPSAGPGDSFYPVLKGKSYPSSSYGPGHDSPSYGAGKYDEPVHFHDSPYSGPPSSYTSHGGPSSSYPSSGGPSSSYPSSGGPSSSYPSSGGPSSSYSSSGGPSSSYPSSGGPPSYSSGGSPSYSSGGSPSYSSGGQPDYHENYAIKSNEPIIGDIRKRLLDYAGASDLYEGEPDYLREVTRNKYKYGNLGNDYYSYGGPVHKDSYREFPYVESKISLIKKSRRL